MKFERTHLLELFLYPPMMMSLGAYLTRTIGTWRAVNTSFSKAKHPIKGLARQRETFYRQVKPLLDEGKVAYVWVDALRFEMARELCRVLAEDFKLEIRPAIDRPAFTNTDRKSTRLNSSH